MNELEGRWIWSEKEVSNAQIRLYCFHHAGGSAVAFKGWAQHLLNVDVKCIQLPGRWSRISEPPFTEMKALVKTLLKEVKPFLIKPFAFFGFSLGALVAYEFAKALQKTNASMPEKFFACSRMAPNTPLKVAPIHQLSNELFISELEKRYGQLPTGLREDPEIQDLLLPSLKADMELLEKYYLEEEVPLTCPITVFSGDQDDSIHDDGLNAWKSFSDVSVDFKKFQAGHFFGPAAIIEMLSEVRSRL